MKKKIAIVENCNECPFLKPDTTDSLFDESFCKKTKLKGSKINLFKVCPLPDHVGEGWLSKPNKDKATKNADKYPNTYEHY